MFTNTCLNHEHAYFNKHIYMPDFFYNIALSVDYIHHTG